MKKRLPLICAGLTVGFLLAQIARDYVRAAPGAPTHVGYTGALGGDVTGTYGATVVVASHSTGNSTATGTASFDYSASSGSFKMPGGVITLGPGAVNCSGNVELMTGVSLTCGSNVLIASDKLQGGQLASGSVGSAALAASSVDLSTSVATGTLKSTSFPAMTGDCTSAGGSLATTVVAIHNVPVVAPSGNHTILTNVPDAGTAQWLAPAIPSSFSGALVGDVTGTQGATVVAKIDSVPINAPTGNHTIATNVPDAGTVQWSSTIVCSNMPALSGAITSSAGSCATSLADSSVNLASNTVTGVLPAASGGGMTGSDSIWYSPARMGRAIGTGTGSSFNAGALTTCTQWRFYPTALSTNDSTNVGTATGVQFSWIGGQGAHTIGCALYENGGAVAVAASTSDVPVNAAQLYTCPFSATYALKAWTSTSTANTYDWCIFDSTAVTAGYQAYNTASATLAPQMAGTGAYFVIASNTSVPHATITVPNATSATYFTFPITPKYTTP